MTQSKLKLPIKLIKHCSSVNEALICESRDSRFIHNLCQLRVHRLSRLVCAKAAGVPLYHQRHSHCLIDKSHGLLKVVFCLRNVNDFAFCKFSTYSIFLGEFWREEVHKIISSFARGIIYLF